MAVGSKDIKNFKRERNENLKYVLSMFIILYFSPVLFVSFFPSLCYMLCCMELLDSLA